MHMKEVLFRRRRRLVVLIAVAVIVWLGLRFVRVGSRSAPLLGTSQVSAAGESVPVVTVVEPARRVAVQTLTLPASVEAIEKATLYAKVSGYLQWIKVDKGDRVKKGEVLAQLEVPEVEKEYQSAQAAVAESQAEYERAQADAQLKQLTYERTKGVRDLEPTVVSPQEVDVARAASETAVGNVALAKARLVEARAELGKLQVLAEFAKVTAPFDGVVTERFVDPGALIQAGANSSGSPVVSVARIDQVRVYISVPEVDVSQVARGIAAKVRLDALPGRQLAGKVTRFADAVDPRSRTMKTEIDLSNPDRRILPGMFGTVTLELSTDPKAVFLPDQSIRQDSAGNKYVFGIENGYVRKMAIQTGQDDGTVTQVFGLGGDQAIVRSGAENLQEGSRVKAVKESMQGDSHGGH
jgi:membrane fusion protein (multidrug efflux system)